MKLSKSERINKNKEELDRYLSEFERNEIDKYLSLFLDSDFERGCASFKNLYKSKISMPKIGSTTIKYWLARGWSKEEAEKRRVKVKRGDSSPMCVEFWLKSGLSNEEAVYKIRSFRKCNVEFWLESGFTYDEAKLKVTQFQKKNSIKGSEKRRENPEKYSHTYNTKIEYYLNQGMSHKEAELALSERQTTFSKEICIEKYGNVKGLSTWQNRQDNWQYKMSLLDINHLKDSSSIEFLKVKYGNDWIFEGIKLKNMNNFNLIIENIKKSGDVLLFIENYLNSINYESIIKTIYPLCRSTYMQYFYNKSFKELFKMCIEHYGVIATTFGNIRYYNGHICRSDGEYYIAKYLKENNINYLYEIKYNNSNYRCDFYLNDYNVYIEYKGLSGFKKYDDTYLIKEEFIRHNNINCIINENVSEIIKMIEYEVNN